EFSTNTIGAGDLPDPGGGGGDSGVVYSRARAAQLGALICRSLPFLSGRFCPRFHLQFSASSPIGLGVSDRLSRKLKQAENEYKRWPKKPLPQPPRWIGLKTSRSSRSF